MFLSGWNDDEYDNCTTVNKNLSEFEKLKSSFERSGKFFTGMESVHEFKDSRDSYCTAMYICQICQIALKSNELFPHLASNIHIVRHTKFSFPEEYQRIQGVDSFDQRLEIIINLNKLYKKRVAGIIEDPITHDVESRYIKRELDKTLSRIRQKELLLRLEDIEQLNEKDLLDNYNRPSSRPSKAMTTSDSEPDTILSRLKKEKIWESNEKGDDCPQTSEESMSNKVILSGYDTDEIEEETDQTVYLTKIKEKVIYNLDHMCKFSEAFTELSLKELDNLDLSEEYQDKLMEIVFEEEQELDADSTRRVT